MAINNASSYIQWQVVRNNSAFLKRQRGIPKAFSTERFNTKSLNSFRYNGLVNRKGVDVQPNANGKGVTVTLKKKRVTRNPSQSTVTVNFTKDSRRTLKSVRNLLKSYYPSAAPRVTLRASQLLRASKSKAAPAAAAAAVKPAVKKSDA